MRVIRLVLKGLRGFEDQAVGLDFITNERIEEGDAVHLVLKNVYGHDTIMLIGENATGKSTILNAVEAVFHALQHNNLNTTCLNRYFDKKLELTACFRIDNEIVEWNAAVVKLPVYEITSEYRERIGFESESIISKTVYKIRSRKQLYNFEDRKISLTREQVISTKRYAKLNESVSILSVLYEKEMPYYQSIGLTGYHAEAESKTGKYDSTVAVLEQFLGDGLPHMKQDAKAAAEILVQAFRCLDKGGYLLIDDIDRRLSKEMIRLLVTLFQNREVNSQGACLLFACHYVEVIDFIKRKDNVYITRLEQGKPEFINAADKITRSAHKKNDNFLKKLISGTQPEAEIKSETKSETEPENTILNKITTTYQNYQTQANQ